jgi:hypothetical protein
MVGAMSADAANVTFGIRQVGGATNVTVASGTVVNIEITALINDGTATSDGLALWGSDIVFSGTGGARANLAGGLLNDPTGIMHTHFDYPNGVTNPPHVADASGYRGTPSGATNLLQGGGGQNTIGNPASGGAPFPIGTVLEEVAAGGSAVVVATGAYTATGAAGTTHILTLANCFANTIDNNEAGPTVYNVSAATTTCGAALSITVGGGVGGPVTSAVSRRGGPSNCDITLNLAGRTSDPRSPGVSQIVVNYGSAPGATPVTLAWVNPVQACGGGEGTYVAYNGASAMNCVTNPLNITCTFTPALENVRAYRLTVPDNATTRDIKFRGLIGDAAPNPGDGNGVVDSADRSAVVAQWTAPGFSCATDARTDINVSGVTDSADRSQVVGAWTNPNARCVP